MDMLKKKRNKLIKNYNKKIIINVYNLYYEILKKRKNKKD